MSIQIKYKCGETISQENFEFKDNENIISLKIQIHFKDVIPKIDNMPNFRKLTPNLKSFECSS
jgi:hypothetical protein